MTGTPRPVPLTATIITHDIMRLFLCFLCLSAITAAVEPVVPEGVVFLRDIEFARPNNHSLKLNLAAPKGLSGRLPAVIFIHGGGFRQGTRDANNLRCLSLASRGYVALTISYRLSPEYRFPAAIQDCKAAIRWLRAHAAEYNVDPDRIGVMGGSAGGNLVLMLGTTAGVKEFEGAGHPEESTAVACVVSYCGASDFTRSYGRSLGAGETLPIYFDGDLNTRRLEHIKGSPLNWVTPAAAPTLCIHGSEDPNVAHEQSVWIVERLRAVGVEAELLTVQGAGHVIKGDDKLRTEEAAFAFLDRHLKK